MRKTATVSLAAMAAMSLAQAPPLGASYGWSLSGKQYVLGSVEVDRLGPVSLGLATGWEARDTLATVWGPSLSYTWSHRSGFFAGASATVLFGAQIPDVALGAGVGFRF